jgi:hypothetical protein
MIARQCVVTVIPTSETNGMSRLKEPELAKADR